MKLERLSVKITNGQSLPTKLHWPHYISTQFKAPPHRNVTFVWWNDTNSNTESFHFKMIKSCWAEFLVYMVQRCQIELYLHQNMSNEYIWFHMLQRLNSSWNSVGFYYRKCLLCIVHGCRQKHLPDNHILHNTIFKFSSCPFQTINSGI